MSGVYSGEMCVTEGGLFLYGKDREVEFHTLEQGKWVRGQTVIRSNGDLRIYKADYGNAITISIGGKGIEMTMEDAVKIAGYLIDNAPRR